MHNALVIDDSRIPADALCELLSLLDIQARVAYGPRAAILSLKDEAPDVIFVDINMPGVSGFEVMSFIRREPHLAKVPIVVVTVDDSLDTLFKARELGAVDVVIKPASIESLEKALQLAQIA